MKTCATCGYSYPCKDPQDEGDLWCGNKKSKEYGYSNYPGTGCSAWCKWAKEQNDQSEKSEDADEDA